MISPTQDLAQVAASTTTTTSTSTTTTSTTKISTTCPYCGVGCGVSAERRGASLIATDGDKSHPANSGRLCVKGVALKDTVSLEGRLLEPKVGGEVVDWDTAISRVADGFSEVIAKYGPDAVAFYLSGQLLTEDYYVANKLMKGFMGSANVDTNSRLCMASAVAAHKRAFGEDVVPCNYSDLEACDLLVLVGSNAAWTHPVLYQRIVAAKTRKGLKVVVVDPRETATCDIADLHLNLAPGSDADLFVGLLDYLVSTKRVDSDFVARNTSGFDECIEVARGAQARVAAATGISNEKLEQFYDCFARTERVVTMFSQGVNQSESGTDKCNAIINCHLVTGRIGKSGMGPFSITGQPNAMGGREVGGMANQLAGHMDFTEDHIERVADFWQAPNMASAPGLKAVDMFSAIERGEIRAVWIMGTNPVVSLPQADRVKRALERCSLVVVSDCIEATDTTMLADVLLPAAPWGEKDGTVTNSERSISRQRAVFPLAGESRPDWAIICALAAKLGYGDAFGYTNAHEIFSEHAALTSFARNDGRQFDIASLAQLTSREFDEMDSVQWPIGSRPFHDGRFSTPDKRANLIAVTPRSPVQCASETEPFILNTGRLRDQWHTMTRTGLAAALFQHTPVPRVQINPLDLAEQKIPNGELVELVNAHGFVRALAESTPECPRGQMFMPIHWSQQYAWPARVSVLGGKAVDPISGQPESKHLPVSLRAVSVGRWLAVAACCSIDIESYPNLFWSRRPGEQFSRIDIALKTAPVLDELCRSLERCCAGPGDGCMDWIVMEDPASGQQRMLLMSEEQPVAMACLANSWAELPDATVLLTQALASRSCDWRSLSSLATTADSTPVVCTCFEVSRARIDAAITGGAKTSIELGEQLGCGTNCGSCVPELNRILREAPSTLS